MGMLYAVYSTRTINIYINLTVVINEANKDLNLQRVMKRNLGNEVVKIIKILAQESFF
jgi:hypothetical protein